MRDLVIPWTLLATALGVLAAAGTGHAGPDSAEMTASFRAERGGIIQPLDQKSGDAARGRVIVAGRDGNCLACHHMPLPEEQFHGNIGPDLAGVGSRLSESELRLRLVDPKLIDAESIMPAFHKVEGLRQVGRRYRGQPILSAQEIEDVVAYLKTLVD